MSRIEKQLFKKAQNTYKKIYPCGTRRDFTECFVQYDDKICFWFDTEDRSTHMEIADISE